MTMAFRMKNVMRDWQVGDGREQRAADFVRKRARKGDIDHAIACIDEFAYEHSFLINVGDEKGAILDAALARVAAKHVLELGAYVGYSALRIARKLPPGGRLTSIEWSPANAAIARSIIEHAGASDRVDVVVGSLGDGGKTVDCLRNEHALSHGRLDLVFVDHDKDAYVPDVELLLELGWLREGAIVVADNVLTPGAPAYLAWLRANEGKLFRTTEHKTHAEYTSLPDLVTESVVLDAKR